MKCPNCNSTNIKSALIGEEREMRTWCEKCGYVIEANKK